MGCFVVAKFLLTSASRGPSAIAEPLVCHIAAKGVIVNSVNSGVSGLNVTKIVLNVEKFILFNLLKSELRYCNPLERQREKTQIFFYFKWLTSNVP